jgi:hypothetical protein
MPCLLSHLIRNDDFILDLFLNVCNESLIVEEIGMKAFTILFAVPLSMVVAGCAVQKPAGDVADLRATAQKTGFLPDYSDLEPGKDATEGMLRWRDPNAPWGKYNKILVEPVQIWGDAKKDTKNQHDLVTLANYGHAAFVKAIKSRYAVADRPGADTLIVRTAITNAEASNPAMKAISTVMPIGLVASAATEIVTDKPAYAGELQMEFMALDSMTGKVLVKSIDRRVGGRSLAKISDSWSAAKSALDAYADMFVYRFCLLRKEQNCPVPKG